MVKVEHVRSSLGILTVAVLLLLAVGPSIAEAQPGAARPGALSQFVAGKVTGRNFTIYNPNNRETFALAIYYLPDGSLDTSGSAGGCAGVVINSHGTDDDEFGYGDDNTSDEMQGYEVIAVPSTGAIAGRFDLLGTQRLGVLVTTAKGETGHALPPQIFTLPTGGDLTDLIDCACDELSDWSMPSTLLSEVGIDCP